MSEFYWELKTYDGQSVEIKPGDVEVVRRRLGNGDAINTTTATIPAKQVVSFAQTDKRYVDQALLDAASQAFREPQLTDDGVVSKWVKKSVTRDKWNRYYSANPAYRKIGEGSMVEIAFRLPVHQIDVNLVSYCTPDEELALTQS